MEHKDFYIGLEFVASAGFPYRCTDVGQRTILAIALPLPEYHPDADNPAWLQGPPYILDEQVFDEAEMRRCHLSVDASLEETVRKMDTSAHPNFSGEDVTIMSKARAACRTGANRYPPARKGVLRFDRVRGDGEILHPYAAKRDGEGSPWVILALELFTRTHVEVDELEFIALPRSTEADLRARANRNQA